jgi:hypothetical protein
MFTRDDIDFDKLHGEIKSVLERQRELRRAGVKPEYDGNYGYRSWYETNKEKYGSQPWYNADRSELAYLCSRMTVLCSILNYAKSKNHFTQLYKSFPSYKLSRSRHPDSYKSPHAEENLQKYHEELFGEEWKQFIKIPQENAALG